MTLDSAIGDAEAHVVGRILEALQVAAQADLPGLADAALHAEGGLRVGGIRAAGCVTPVSDSISPRKRGISYAATSAGSQREVEIAQDVGAAASRGAPRSPGWRSCAAPASRSRACSASAMVRLGGDERGDERREALLDGDDLVDAGAERREA